MDHTRAINLHRIHHQYARHKNNYGDITWWDMLFGTYENPKEWTQTCGFDTKKEQQLIKMLACRDVNRDGSRVCGNVP
jgi:sterol desaturase/sphingolipid hydroxylase (fatty acid hydroxylase superfamily)